MITRLRKQLNIENFDQKDKSVPLRNLDIQLKPETSSIKEFSKEEKIRCVIDSQSISIDLDKFCSRFGISIKMLNMWTNQYLADGAKDIVDEPKRTSLDLEDRFKIVIEGKTGVTSIAEICRREEVDQNTFLNWCEEFHFYRHRDSLLSKLNNSRYQRNKFLIEKSVISEVFKYFENYIDFSDEDTLLIQKEKSNRLLKTTNLASNVVSLNIINNIRYVNKYFERVNNKMQNGGIFIGCMETYTARKERSRFGKIPLIGSLYFGFEFIFKRILPKLSFTKGFYFNYTKGKDRLLSKAEGLGRLVSCGFQIMDYKSINGRLYFVVKKIQNPFFDESPSYGPLYKMPRLGKGGNIIGVFKLRTMHPYSEYLQDYVLKANGYASTGKPADDFRIPAWGKFMRRFWLDEIPQLFNVLKGEMKLVGVRPVSKRYFQDIPQEMQKLRLKVKPGCIPPYVSLNHDSNVMSVLQSERQYLEDWIKNPYFTDFKYFWSAIFNILIKNKRSA